MKNIFFAFLYLILFPFYSFGVLFKPFIRTILMGAGLKFVSVQVKDGKAELHVEK